LCTDTVSWTTARDRCRSYGFGLAIIDTQAENDFLRARPNPVNRWMGANDRGNDGGDCRLNERDNKGEGTWYWADPTSTNANTEDFKLFCAFADSNATSCTVMNGAYQNWRAGEPNNSDCDRCFLNNCPEGQDCGVFQAEGTWDDSQCNSNLGFICETP
jgi:hypothetical protein